MKLSEYAANRERLARNLHEARAAMFEDVRVNNGIRGSTDISFILNNKAVETVDWSPLYKYAEQFD
ncbi:MAG: hypothetical protein HQL39_10890 [Alphaproteobacteria bacterium]|nr:hypothetical protein [Alphaproteobacteria bacterium]